MDDMQLAELAAVRDVLVVTSTFGDGGPPDNGAGFWDRLHAADAPALGGVRYAVLGIGDRSYANFCGHAKAIDAPAGRRWGRRGCSTAPTARPTTTRRWRGGPTRVTALVGAPAEPAAPAARFAPPGRRRAEPFTRAKPMLAPLCAQRRC